MKKWRKVTTRFKRDLGRNLNWQFGSDVLSLIWSYKRHSFAIILVTVIQELAALWPVSLLGQFIDRLAEGEVGSMVWLLLGASLLAPGISRANMALRAWLFYKADLRERAKLVFAEAERKKGHQDIELVGAAHTRAINAVAGIVEVMHHILGSFIPVIIKTLVVLINLLAYNRLLGLVYLASLSLPSAMTVFFNSKLRVLRDAQYSAASEVSGSGVKTIAENGEQTTRRRYWEVSEAWNRIRISLVSRSQIFRYLRQVALGGGQFLVVLLALGMRTEIGLSPGDFTRIIGYTSQVTTSFMSMAMVLDTIIGQARAYHVFAQASNEP